MTLLIPLALVTAFVKAYAWWQESRGAKLPEAWNSWAAALACGLASVFLCTCLAHFFEPARSGLVAIVPEWMPAPDAVVLVTGLLELLLVFGLVWPGTRRAAGWASALLLIAMFPANIVAANGVAHPAAPSTPLVPRILLQTAFVAVAVAVAVLTKPQPRLETGHRQPE